MVALCRLWVKRSWLIITVVLSNNIVDLTLSIQDVIKYIKNKRFANTKRACLKPNLGFQMGSYPPRRPKVRPKMSKIALQMPRKKDE